MKIKKTTNYGLFSTIKENRNINETHVKKLMRSFQQEQLVTPITVNTKGEVIDGQHRLEVCKRLGLPVYYFEVEGYSESQMQRLNSNSKNWSTSDFIDSQCSIGAEHYIFLKQYIKMYGVSISASISLLSGGNGMGGSDTLSVFKEGRFIVTNEQEAMRLGQLFKDAAKLTKRANPRTLISALSHCSKNSSFVDAEFLHKLSLKPSAFTGCSGKDEFLVAIEDVYNHGRRGQKIGLRY